MNVLAPVGGADLEKLTRELNLIDRSREDHVYQLGLKLIPIRQMLQAMNGARGKVGADGLRPAGWYAWCESVGVSQTTATDAVHRAVNPDLHRARKSERSRLERRKPDAAIRILRCAWPNWTEADRQKIIDTIVELAHGA